jgi:hypothetical protein
VLLIMIHVKVAQPDRQPPPAVQQVG